MQLRQKNKVSSGREQGQIQENENVQVLGGILKSTNSTNLSVFLLSFPLGLGGILSIDSRCYIYDLWAVEADDPLHQSLGQQSGMRPVA